MSHVLEAPFGDEAEPPCGVALEPPCGVALALQLFALAVLHHLALALAKLAQRLNIRSAWPLGLSKNAIFPEFLFHRQSVVTFGAKVRKVSETKVDN